MNNEQLGFDFSLETESEIVINTADSPEHTESEGKNADVVYELLDYQLAKLMQDLNGEKNQTLNDYTLEVSKHTREGNIAIAIDDDVLLAELLSTKVVGIEGEYKPLILNNSTLYLRRYWQYQENLVNNISSRLSTQPQDDSHSKWIKERLAHYFNEDTKDEEPEKGKEVNWQQIAAERALNHQFLILSGGPGTGKTTTITRILALLIEQNVLHNQTNQKIVKSGGGVLENVINNTKQNKLRISLAAPTGKAAIRMLDAIRDAQQNIPLTTDIQEQMPTSASTIHKLLGYKHESVQFKHNKNNPLNTDVVLIDEASMIDIALMSKLLEAIPKHATLILIGDKDQLSSVETGSVFTDMCRGLEGTQNLVTLQKNWRFSQDSGIGQLAIFVNKGDSKKTIELLESETVNDCRLIDNNTINQHQISARLTDIELTKPWGYYFTALNNPDSSIQEIFEAFDQYRILCALRRGLSGSTLISRRIETSLNQQNLIDIPFTRNTNQSSQNWYHGRPVMITQNSYSKGLFNGDTGITLIRNGKTKVYFPNDASSPEKDREAYKSIAPVRLPSHETTWAMTIHKSQGSEFDQVTLILPTEVIPLLTKQLIYTGITRARIKVNIIASKGVIIAGVNTQMVQATRAAEHLLIVAQKNLTV